MAEKRSSVHIASVLISLILGACSGTIRVTSSGQNAAPTSSVGRDDPPGSSVQIRFSADSRNLNPGECTQLQWNVQGGYQVQLNGFNQARSGSREACPEETKTYELCVDAGEEWECRQLTIAVGDAQQGPTSSPASTQAPGNPAPAATLPVAGAQKATLIVANETSAVICYAYLSTNASTTGVDLLGNFTLLSLNHVSFEIDALRQYYIRIDDCYHNRYYDQSMYVGTDRYTITVEPLVLDLKISDLYPDSQPIGDLWLRLTHMGHARAVNTWADIVCDLYPTVQIGPNHFTNGTPIHQEFRVSSPANPGETLSRDTGIYLNMNSTTYNSTCRIVRIGPGFIDPNSGNNSYSEDLP